MFSTICFVQINHKSSVSWYQHIGKQYFSLERHFNFTNTVPMSEVIEVQRQQPLPPVSRKQKTISGF